MNDNFRPWEIHASRGRANRKWSYRKAFLFVSASSIAFWAAILLLLR
ncbi:MAG TPA: hypothetical protein VHX18_11430 [Rhizomicrobium sp.]|jgi:hypothetical protein|nr:hypothetical protein [Rhizomicrobium sp.]